MKKLSLIIIASLATSSFSIFASQPENKKNNSRFFIGGSYSRNSSKVKLNEYEENLNDKANPWNLFLGYEYLSKNNIYSKTTFCYGLENLKYTYENNNLKIKIKNMSAKSILGYSFDIHSNSKFFLTPFVGIEYNQKNFKAQDEDYSDSFKEKSFYLPFGIAAKYSINSKVDLGVVLEAKYSLDRKLIGKNESDAEGYDDSKDNNELKLEKNINFSIELPIKYHINSNWDIALTPSYTNGKLKGKIKDEDYNSEGIVYIKDNKLGAKLELGFNF